MSMKKKPSKKPLTNKEGLAFEEWLLAATFGAKISKSELAKLYPEFGSAWRIGVDPTEYAAILGKGGKE